MDKRLDFTGGNPDIRIDQILIDAEANRPALFAMLKPYAVGTIPNFKISGCDAVITGVSPNNTWVLDAGYIFLNDEILEVEAQSGVFDESSEILVFSKSVTYDPKGDITYNDATPRQTWQKNRGVVASRVDTSPITATELDADSGDTLVDKLRAYIDESDTNTLGLVEKATQAESTAGTSGKNITADLMQGALRASDSVVKTGTVDNQWVSPSTLAAKDGGLVTAPIDIGDWDMDTDASSTVDISSLGISSKDDIKEVSAIIRSDSGAVSSNLKIDFADAVNFEPQGAIGFINNTSVILSRKASGSFDSSSYNSTSYNRGWVTIRYTP